MKSEFVGQAHYRSEIDGLGALAILYIIFYHLGSKAFSGGFVGFDIFLPFVEF